jgi:hypothetical protein
MSSASRSSSAKGRARARRFWLRTGTSARVRSTRVAGSRQTVRRPALKRGSPGDRAGGRCQRAGAGVIHHDPLGEFRVAGTEADYEGFTHRSFHVKTAQADRDVFAAAFQQTVQSGLGGANRGGHTQQKPARCLPRCRSRWP